MSRMVFADPFGTYTQGFREGQQDELALGMYNLNARRAGTDYDKAMQVLRLGDYEYGLRQKLDPLRQRSAEAQLFQQETDAGARAARMTRDPRTLQRALSYFGPGYSFDAFGNATTPDGQFGLPARTFLEGADVDFAALPGMRQGQSGSSGVGPWSSGYMYDPFGAGVASAPATEPAPEEAVPPEAAPPLPYMEDDGAPWQAARFMGERFRGGPLPATTAGYGPAFATAGALGDAVREWYEPPASFVDPNTGGVIDPSERPSPAPRFYGPVAPAFYSTWEPDAYAPPNPDYYDPRRPVRRPPGPYFAR